MRRQKSNLHSVWISFSLFFPLADRLCVWLMLSAAACTELAQSRCVRPIVHVCRFRCQAFAPRCDLHVGKRAVQYSTFICILCAPLLQFSIQVCCWRLWDLSHLAF